MTAPYLKSVLQAAKNVRATAYDRMNCVHVLLNVSAHVSERSLALLSIGRRIGSAMGAPISPTAVMIAG